MKNENRSHVFVKVESEDSVIILMYDNVDAASKMAQELVDHCPFPMKVTVLFLEDDDDEHE